MQIVVKNDVIMATHEDWQPKIAEKYPDCQVFWMDDPPIEYLAQGIDPRSPAQKAEYYKDQRRRAYPAIGDQLDEIFKAIVALPADNPLKVALSPWLGALQAVKDAYPKP